MNKNSFHYKKAVKSIKTNNVSDAVAELKLSLKFNSKSVAALNLLGLAYYLKCRFDKAEKMWKKSLRLKKDNNKARDYLELITKRDFKEIRNEYKKILFNNSGDQAKKIKFLKRLIEEHNELIEPYVILGLLYKKEGKYQEALKYFYQAYDLDSSNQNIKNYILDCEKAEKDKKKFKFNLNTNHKSAAVAGVIAFLLIALFLNFSGISPLGWFDDQISDFNLLQSAEQTQSQGKNTVQNQVEINRSDQQSENSNLKTDSAQENTGSQSFQNISAAKQEFNLENNKSQNNFSSTEANILNTINFINDQAILSLDKIKEINQRESEKAKLKEVKSFLEDGTEQQLFNLAMDYFSRGDYQEGADIFKSIYNLSEKEYLKRESLFLLARSYDKLDKYDAAEHYYRIYLNEYNDTNYYDESLYNLGLMLNKAGKTKKSREILEKLRNEAPYSKYNNSQVYQILK